MTEPFEPTITITITAGNVADLRRRIVRERLLPCGSDRWSVVREVFEAFDGGEVALRCDERGVEPPVRGEADALDPPSRPDLSGE